MGVYMDKCICDDVKLMAQYKDALGDIIGIGFDYDDCHTVEEFKELVDDLVGIARMALKGKYNYIDYCEERNGT